ncbi:acyl-CoA dehydrogenase family protein [Streptomyces sp. NPDC014773]|uniref:acyl-CoA dehydrogenase family protein n=1 Tax=Streptomyces sp. NPDC014773 TaxID=3364908 RepID=UPI0036FA33E5
MRPLADPAPIDVTASVRAAERGADFADRAGRLAPEVVSALVRAGFGRHFVPSAHGGSAGGFAPLVAAVGELGASCASAAWCGMLFAAHGRLAAYLPERARRELWGTSPDTLIAAGVAAPTQEAEPLADGHLLTGRWPNVSAVEHADFVLVSAWVPAPEGRKVRLFLVPAGQCDVEETWDPLGMRGTGSNTVSLDGVFVPDHRSVAQDRLLSSAPAADGARCHSVPFPLVAALMFAAPVLGAARGMLDAWTREVGTAREPDGTARIESPRAAAALSRTSAELRAAELLLTEAALRADTCEVEPRTTAEVIRDAVAATEWCVASSERLMAAGGSRALRFDGPVQRRWRDIRTASEHAMLRFDTAAAGYARAWAPAPHHVPAPRQVPAAR